MDAMEEIKQTFFEECDEQLSELEVGLLNLQEGNHDLEKINEIFRAVHSIKGGAGAFNLDTLVHFSHIFENTLDLIRSEKLDPDEAVVNTMLRATDVLFDLVNAAKEDVEVSKQSWEPLSLELAAINEKISGSPKVADNDAGEADEPLFEPMAIGDLDGGGLMDLAPLELESLEHEFKISFKPKPELFATANEPMRILYELATLGDADIQCDISDIPMLDEIDPAGAYLSWTIVLKTEENESGVREPFDFVEGDCLLEIDEVLPDAAIDVDISEQIAISTGNVSLDEPEAKKDEDVAEKKPVKAAARKKSSKPAAQASATVRVDVERIDKLINLVGELVITQSMLSLQADKAGTDRSDSVRRGLEGLEQLTREIQDSVMAIRAQPVKSLFQRMSRVAREASTATGKKILLKSVGENTEVDKTVIERLADPLTHMIRNGADHGLESAEDRLAAGKPEEGTITLSAFHRSGRVIIEVSDDGAGINRERVRKIAEEKKLVSSDDQLSDNEIDNLIFMPGFSTVDKVSAMSGRGVGMDVVKNSIQSLGGKVSISSEPGKGSTFTMSLPLTLAVLEGMIVTVCDQTFIIPLTAVTETLRLEDRSFHSLGSNSSVVCVRDQFVPIIDVGVVLGLRKTKSNEAAGTLVMVETESGSLSALLVDQIQDQRQVVIKSLDNNYGTVQDIAAATVLGDGRVALILDVESLVYRSPVLETEPEMLFEKVG